MFKTVFRFLGKLILWFFISSFIAVFLFKFIPVPFTPLMFIRTFEQIQKKESIVWKHDWVPIEEISVNLQKAVIVSEDGHFISHRGFDFDAIKKALKSNEKESGKLKGGSTISQQTAKNVFLWPKRSYIRKGFEAYFTILIELLWSKERILEVYLNSIEMGNGIYGAQAASKYWYKKDASKLSVTEAAGLAVILPSPRRYNPVKSGPYVAKRKALISRYIRQYGPLEFKKEVENKK